MKDELVEKFDFGFLDMTMHVCSFISLINGLRTRVITCMPVFRFVEK